MVRVNTHDPERQEVVSRRTMLLGGGFSLLTVGIAGRLYQLQILDHQKYVELAQENQFNRRVLTPLRGEIIRSFRQCAGLESKKLQIALHS